MTANIFALRHLMLTTGSQLRAARALAEIEQIELAEAAGVSIGTVRNMEAQGGETLRSGLATVRAVQEALERRGIEFLNHGQPGVRLRSRRMKGNDPAHGGLQSAMSPAPRRSR